ncbi:unnamed protein product [Diamesa hyperborea]
MAMYYYASKLSVVACGIRCRQTIRKNNKSSNNRKKLGSSPDDEDNYTNKDKELTPIKMVFFNSDISVISGNSVELPEVCCENAPANNNVSIINTIESGAGILGKGGPVTVYCDGKPLDLLVDRFILEELDQDFLFSFLLSSRIFIRPHELLGKLMETVPVIDESLGHIVGVIGIWTKTFPYDFRDERIMNHVKHIVARCADTTLGDTMSDLLSALLIKLTDLEKHEEEMKYYKKFTEHQQSPVKWPNSTKLAQLLCRIERKYAKFVGPEEFVQCSANLIKEPTDYDVPSTSGSAPGVQDSKKTCNLENYFEWSSRLRLFVANEILQCSNNEYERNNKIELWSGAAQYCLLVGNYNSATSILEPISKLQTMWSKLSSTTSQQLDCMKHHSENCGNLWNKQTEYSAGSVNINNTLSLRKTKRIQIITPNSSPPPLSHQPSTSTISSSINTKQKPKSNEWVVLPVFVDIIRLALKTREDCSCRLPNSDINVTAFKKMAAIVGAFTRHISEISTITDNNEFDYLINHIFSCPLRSEHELFSALERETSKIESYYES